MDNTTGDKLQKVLAALGVASRRISEQMIKDGRVWVNDEVAHIGMRVVPQDEIVVDGKRLKHSTEHATAVLIYHKPVGQICTRDDPEGRDTVFDALPRCPNGRWVSIGRLDINTSGLLIFTNDGDLAHRLMHPRFTVQREYAIRTLGEVTQEIARKLTHGLKLEDGFCRFEHLFIDKKQSAGVNFWCKAVLMEGRCRIVRRMFDAVGLAVSRLVRVRFGPIMLPERLGRGRYQLLSPAAIAELREWIQTEDESVKS